MAQSRYSENAGYSRRVVPHERLNDQRRVNPKSSERKINRPQKQGFFKSLFSKMENDGEIDYTFLFLVILIVAVGLVVMLSASAPSGKTSYDYFIKQLIFIVLGFIGMFMVANMNLEPMQKYLHHAFCGCVVLLIIVLIPGIGVKVNGARRWISIFKFQIQPSEFMKPIIAMYIAYLIKTKMIDLKTLKGNMICVALLVMVAGLLMCETHMSGTIIILGIAICVMLVGGTPLKWISGAGLIGVLGAFLYLQFDSTRMSRLTAMIDPFANSQTTGYQISQSLYAIGSGRLFGLGLGQSVQKYSNLPEPYNDFIFSIVCEELGFFGAVVIILLFLALFLRAIRIAVNAPDQWSTLTAVGIAVQVGLQTVFNMGVAISLIPNTGVSLPFFSYGGTSIFTLLLEMGILLNISRKSVKE